MFALYLCTSAAPKLTALTAKYYLLFQCNIFQRSMHHALLFCVYKHKHLGLKLAFQWGFFFFLCNLLQAANSQLVIREVRATTAMRENSMKQINIRASHNGPLPKTYRTTKVGFFRFCLLFFSVFFMDAECRSLGPDDLLSKRVTRVSWEVDQLRRRRARLIIHILPRGKKLFIAVVRHSTGFYIITL